MHTTSTLITTWTATHSEQWSFKTGYRWFQWWEMSNDLRRNKNDFWTKCVTCANNLLSYSSQAELKYYSDIFTDRDIRWSRSTCQPRFQKASRRSNHSVLTQRRKCYQYLGTYSGNLSRPLRWIIDPQVSPSPPKIFPEHEGLQCGDAFTGQAVREKALKGNTFPRQQAQTATFCSTFSISHRTSGKSMAYQQTPACLRQSYTRGRRGSNSQTRKQHEQ